MSTFEERFDARLRKLAQENGIAPPEPVGQGPGTDATSTSPSTRERGPGLERAMWLLALGTLINAGVLFWDAFGPRITHALDSRNAGLFQSGGTDGIIESSDEAVIEPQGQLDI